MAFGGHHITGSAGFMAYGPRNLGNSLFGPVLVALGIVYCFRVTDFSGAPSEDAAILMRYSEHLASGAGIVWNIGERPVDGATDFLFMVIIAGLVRAGVPTEAAVLGVGWLSHVVTIAAVYWVLVKQYRVHVLVSVFCSLCLVIGPGRGYVSAYFGTTFFAMLAAGGWLFFLRALNDPTARNAAGFATFSLLLGLDRPEGVFLSVFMLAGLVLQHGWRRARSILFSFALTVGVIGGTYFAWHWAYFGYPLPNPFYKKGGGALYLSGLRTAMKYLILFTQPVWPMFAVGLLFRETARRTAIVLMPIVGFTGIWIFLSDEMNWVGRFQYAVMPLALMAWPETVPRRLYQRAAAILNSSRRVVYLGLALGVVFMFVVTGQWNRALALHADGRLDLGRRLSEFKDRGYVLAVTESGLVPFYSKWKTVDVWGLNDQFIAHNGIITAGYLDQYMPHVLLFHQYADSRLPNWQRMIEVLKEYAAERHYVLAAAWGESSSNLHCYFVLADFAESARIIELIRDIQYGWGGSGWPTFNYALTPDNGCG